MDAIPDNRLVIYPRAISARADMSALLSVLSDAELIGAALASDDVGGEANHFSAGSRFFDHVSFLGCSPALKMEPPSAGEQGAAAEFCHIAIDCSDEVKFLGGANVRPPQCPQCKAVDEDWQMLMPIWRKAPEVFTRQCQNCGATKPLHMYNWRRTAGFAALSVHIYGVHQSEAIPGDALLDALQALTRCPWEYFYRNGNGS